MLYHTSATSSREPAAAYGLAPYVISASLTLQLALEHQPVRNNIGQRDYARFNLGADFNVITRPEDKACGV